MLSPANSANSLNSLDELSVGRTPRFGVASTALSYPKGSEIYGEKEPADYIYQVMTGAVRSYKLLSDGRRQIGAFHLVGDVFGLESETYRFTTEAVVDTVLRLVKRRSLERLVNIDLNVAHNLLKMTV